MGGGGQWRRCCPCASTFLLVGNSETRECGVSTIDSLGLRGPLNWMSHAGVIWNSEAGGAENSKFERRGSKPPALKQNCPQEGEH